MKWRRRRNINICGKKECNNKNKNNKIHLVGVCLFVYIYYRFVSWVFKNYWNII